MHFWRQTVIQACISGVFTVSCAYAVTPAVAPPGENEVIPDVVAMPSAVTQRVPVISLREATEIALKRSPLAARYQFLVGSSQDQVKAAKGLWFPQVTFEAGKKSPGLSSNSTSGRETLVTANAFQTIYDFGRISGQVKEAEYNNEAKLSEFEDAQNQVVVKVGQAYIDILKAQDLIKATISGKQAIEKIRNMSKMRSDAGLSSASDYQQADVRIQNLNANLAQLTSNLGSAESSLESQTGLRARSYMSLPLALDTLVITPVSVFDQIPSLLNAEATRGVADSRIKQAKADRFATIGFQYTYNHSLPDAGATYPNHLGQFVLKRATPIQGNITGNKIRAAENDRNAAQAQIDNVRRELNEQVSIYDQNLIAAKTKELAYTAQYQQAQKTSETFQEEYKLGKRSLFELLNIEQQVLDSNLARITSAYDQRSIRLQYAGVTNKLRYLVSGGGADPSTSMEK